MEVTELTDITYTSNLVKLRPGHINVVLVLTDATKNILLSKFAKEVYSFTGSVFTYTHYMHTAKKKRQYFESIFFENIQYFESMFSENIKYF